jgi:hypothetical protein
MTTLNDTSNRNWRVIKAKGEFAAIDIETDRKVYHRSYSQQSAVDWIEAEETRRAKRLQRIKDVVGIVAVLLCVLILSFKA